MKKNALKLVLILLVIISCDKSEQLNFGNELHHLFTENIIFSDDIIVLQNATELKSLLDYIQDNQSDVDMIINHIKEEFKVTTMREIYEHGMNVIEDYNSFIEYVNDHPSVFTKEKIDDDIFYELSASNISSFILNKDGCIIISDTMLYINKKGSYLYTVDKITSNDGSVSYSPNELIRFTANNRPHGALKGQYSYRTVYYSSSRRLVARLYFWEIDYPGFTTMHEYEARSTAQRKQLGAWFQVRIDQVGISHNGGTVNHVGWGTTTYSPASYTQNNRADIRQTLHTTPAYNPVNHSTSSLVLKHFGTWDNNYGYKEITNNELFP